jgi:adenylate cyclase
MGPEVPRVERRLTAIFAADVAGYSRLMHEDEVGTLRTLIAHREIMDGLISEYGGRIANTAGDSVLAEFPSIVDAVECAASVQEKLRASNAIGRSENRLAFRIGVHVGDVMVRGHDLLGDGVNIAARIQALAEPGGVMLSSRAYDEIVGKLNVEFEDWGEQQVKNVTRPVRVYALVGGAPGGTARAASPSLPDKPSVAVLPVCKPKR